MTSLTGMTILVTRPADQSVELLSMIERRGAAAIPAPTIEVIGVRSAALTRALADLAAGRFEWVTLTSRATVEMLQRRLGEAAEIRARVAAIGEGTGEAFRAWAGREPDLVPRSFTTAALARALPRGRGRVLCPRADIAPDGLEAAIESKGWSATRVDAYRTRLARRLPAEASAALRQGLVDAVTFTSASTVRGFVSALDSTRGSVRLDGKVKVVCIGPVSAREARAHGMRVSAVASPHTIEGLVAALERVFG